MKLNKEAKTPFPLYLTGVSPEIQDWLKTNYVIDETGANFPVEITEKHQTELFPKERLVYLSPDSKNDLMEFDDDDIYVIGGIIDKGDDYSPPNTGQCQEEPDTPCEISNEENHWFSC